MSVNCSRSSPTRLSLNRIFLIGSAAPLVGELPPHGCKSQYSLTASKHGQAFIGSKSW